MTGYRFADGVSACRPADRYILLDLARDRYFGLCATSERALSRLIAGTTEPGDEPAITTMTGLGLLVRATEGQRPRLCPGVPLAVSVRSPTACGASRWRVALASLAIVQARRGLRRRGFAAMIAALRQRRPAEPHGSADRQEAITSAFRGSVGLVSGLDQCLPRSMALAYRLFAAGLDADMIIGVAVQPFRAHCWVQCRGRLVLDDIDTVRQFTPILVL